MDSVTYRIVDAFDGDNLSRGFIQRLPAYLVLSFTDSREYNIFLKTPNKKIINTLSGKANSGYVNYWRIPIFNYPGKWKIVIETHKGQSNVNMQEIEIKVSKKMFSIIQDEGGVCDDEYMSELTQTIPSDKEIQYIDSTSRLAELDAHWLQIDKKYKLWRYIYEDDEGKASDESRFIPILLAHGFHSDYTTWNWMVRYLWAEGFRNIFGMNLHDDSQGVQKNAEKMRPVVDEVLKLTNHKYLYFLGHSLGGLVGRYYVKKYDARKIKLMVSMASPHLSGLNRLWGKVFVILKKNAQLTERDCTLRPSSSLAEAQAIVTEEDFYTQTMVNICGTRVMGGDGGFKLKDNLVPDMINLGSHSIHMNVNKKEDTYKYVHNFIFNISIVYKIRLLYVNPIKDKPEKCKLSLHIKPRDGKDYQRYPLKGYIELEKNEPYLPEIPLIVYSNFHDNAETEHIEIQIKNEGKVVLTKEHYFALGFKKPVCDNFEIDTTLGYSLQFAVYSYKLN